MMTMRPGGRLVTLTGPGGVGKTRLALAVARLLRDRFCAGMVFVPLAAGTDLQLVLSGIGRALGADLGQTGSPLQALAEQLGDDAWLLILDNLEQVTEVARDLGELLARCRGVSILATSRAVLGLRAEREYPVPALRLPADPATASLEDIAASPAVALFADRARAVRPPSSASASSRHAHAASPTACWTRPHARWASCLPPQATRTRRCCRGSASCEPPPPTSPLPS